MTTDPTPQSRSTRDQEVKVLRFGVFEMDLRAGELRRSGHMVRIQPQPFKVLSLLASRPGEVITREEIQAEVWAAGTFVDFEQSLNFCIRQIRSALGDNALAPRYVETLPRRGYRWVGGSVEQMEPPARRPWPRVASAHSERTRPDEATLEPPADEPAENHEADVIPETPAAETVAAVEEPRFVAVRATGPGRWVALAAMLAIVAALAVGSAAWLYRRAHPCRRSALLPADHLPPRARHLGALRAAGRRGLRCGLGRPGRARVRDAFRRP